MTHTTKIIRNSIHVFFTNYTTFTSIASLLVFPFSASFLLSQSYIISSPYSLHFISSRVKSLFQSASFPLSSNFISLINLMLSQTILSTIVTLPFTLSFLLLAKICIIHITRNKTLPTISSSIDLYFPLLLTHLFNSFLIISANATVFIFLFMAFNTSVFLGFNSSYLFVIVSSVSAMIYSMVIANVIVTCNFAIFVSVVEKCSGYVPVLKAFVLIRGKIGSALSITLPTGLLMAGVEALFQYRVMAQYYAFGKLNASIICEAFMIAYMHSVVVVVEIIASCLFYLSCKSLELEPFFVRFDSSFHISVVYPSFFFPTAIPTSSSSFTAPGRDSDLISSRLRSEPNRDGRHLVVPTEI